MSLDRNSKEIVARFRTAVRQQGSLPAIEFDRHVWSYAELDWLSDDLAGRIASVEAGADAVAVIDGERSPFLVVAALACVKAGIAYFVIGENQPESYVARVIEAFDDVVWVGAARHSNAQRAHRIARDRLRGCHLFDSDEYDNSQRVGRDVHGARREIGTTGSRTAAEGMYLVATSGTSGRPKLVFTGAGPVLNFIDWYQRAFSLSARDKFSMLSGLGYDPLVRDIFVPLCVGACIVIPGKDVLGRRHGLRDWIRGNSISVVHATPQVAEVVFDGDDGSTFDSLRVVAIGGATLSRRLAAAIKARLTRGVLVNVYGTSETPQVMTWHVVEDAPRASDSGMVPIGKPISEVSVRLLDDDGVAVNSGDVGEIHIATSHLSFGYYRDPVLTAQKFATCAQQGCRSYRTGDLGFIDADGNLNLVGRKDRQVKYRGYRIQLEEIERAILSMDSLIAAAVVLESGAGVDRLVGYVEYRSPARHRLAELKQQLLNVLPTYMTPDSYVVLERMPLTSSNKIDFRALASAKRAESVAPRTASALPKNSRVAQELLSIWSEVLGVSTSSIALDSNFFDVGGTSLLSARVVDHINKLFSKQLKVTDLFVYSNISDLSEYIARKGDALDLARDPSRIGKRADRVNRISLEKNKRMQESYE